MELTMWGYHHFWLLLYLMMHRRIIFDFCGIWWCIVEHIEFWLYPVSDNIYSIYERFPCFTNNFITKIKRHVTCNQFGGGKEGGQWRVFQLIHLLKCDSRTSNLYCEWCLFFHLFNFMNLLFAIIIILIKRIKE